MLQKMVNSKNGTTVSSEQLKTVSCRQVPVGMFVEEQEYSVAQVFVSKRGFGPGLLEELWKGVALYLVDGIDVEPNWRRRKKHLPLHFEGLLESDIVVESVLELQE